MTIPKHLENYHYQPTPMTVISSTMTHKVYAPTEVKKSDEVFHVTYHRDIDLDDIDLESVVYLAQISDFFTGLVNYQFDMEYSQDEDHNYIAIFGSTLKHISKGYVFTQEELQSLDSEQISELALYSSIQQFNEICSLELCNEDIDHALSLRYLFFFRDEDCSISDFCDLYELDGGSVFFFMEEVNLETHCYLNHKFMTAVLLSQLETPPTYDFIELFHEYEGIDSRVSVFGFSDFANIDFFYTIDGFEHLIDRDVFIQGYNKHFMFYIDGMTELVQDRFENDEILMPLSSALDTIHRTDLDKKWLEKLFSFKPNNEIPFISGWGDNWTSTYYFDFNKGTLFDHWMAHKYECGKDDEYRSNMKYILNNFEHLLDDSDFNFDVLIHSIQADESSEDLSANLNKRDAFIELAKTPVKNKMILTELLAE